jgi:hypothetical protein
MVHFCSVTGSLIHASKTRRSLTFLDLFSIGQIKLVAHLLGDFAVLLLFVHVLFLVVLSALTCLVDGFNHEVDVLLVQETHQGVRLM